MESESHSLSFLMRYFKRYRRQLLLMALTLLVASMMQMNEGRFCVHLGRTTGSPHGMCDVQRVFSRYDRTTLEELILLPLEDGGGILDVDAEVGKYLSDEDLRRLLFEVYGIEHPLSLQNMEKTRRNEIIGHLKSEGGGIVADFCLDRMLLLSTKNSSEKFH